MLRKVYPCWLQQPSPISLVTLHNIYINDIPRLHSPLPLPRQLTNIKLRYINITQLKLNNARKSTVKAVANTMFICRQYLKYWHLDYYIWIPLLHAREHCYFITVPNLDTTLVFPDTTVSYLFMTFSKKVI